eukprot:gene8962-9702_t
MNNLANQQANNVVPEAFGTAIPSNPADLLKFIQLQKQQQKLQSNQTSNESQDIAQERLKKQDHEREKYELVAMGQEDVLSENLAIIFKEYDQERFRAKIRQDIEKRKAQEIAERQAKQKAAEERRAAVVERIRRQKELEEQRKREAELALLKIEEEKLRKIRMEEERFKANQEQMMIEDQISMFVEQEYREYLEKKLWQQREKQRLLEWEKQQREKDALEEEARKLRMKELEEKKKKLELLRQQQQQKQNNNNNNAEKEQREKMNKQMKIQNRAKFVSKKIAENNNNLNNEQVIDVVDHNSSTSQINHLLSSVLPPVNNNKEESRSPRRVDENNDNSLRTPAPAVLTKHKSVRALDAIIFQSPPTKDQPSSSSTSTVNLHTNPSMHGKSSMRLQGGLEAHFQNPELMAEIQNFSKDIEKSDNEPSLKQMQNEMMVKKRALRIEQRQKLMHQIDENHESSHTDGAAVSLTTMMNDNTKQQLFLLNEKMTIVEKRLQEIQQIQQDAKTKQLTGTTTETMTEAPSILTSPVARLSKQPSLRHPPPSSSHQLLNQSSLEEKKTANLMQGGIAITSRPPSAGQRSSNRESGAVNNNSDLFKKCETCIRNANKHLMQASEVITVPLTSPSHSALTKAVQSTEEHIHHLTSLSLEILSLNQQFSNAPNKTSGDFDPLGYREKLPQTNDKITSTLPKLQDKLKALQKTLSETNLSPRPTSSGSQRRPVKIYSRTNSASNNNPPSAITSPSPRLSESKTAGVITEVAKNSISENKLMSSFSEPSIPISHAEMKKSPRPHDAPEAVHSVTKETLNDDLKIVTGTEESKKSEKSKDEEEEEAGEDPSKLPGWEECIYTSMFSAAHHAAFFGYVEVLSFLCKYFDCFIMDKKGRTPLFYAALNNRLDCVALLLALDPQWIDVGDEKGDTTLHAATISNSLQVLAFLLSCEIHPDIANYSGLTPSHLAKSKESLQLLNNAGAQLYCVDNLSRTPLWYSCYDGRSTECIEYLCNKTPTEFLLWKDQDGETCLHTASSKGYSQCIDIVCQYIFNIDDLNIINNKKYTAAHLANNANVLRILYENGANLWIMDENKGRMPLFIASFFGRIDCVAFLLELAGNPSTGSSTKMIKSLTSPIDSVGKKNGISNALSSSSLSLSTAASSTGSGLFSPTRSSAINVIDNIRAKDKAGDTALHVAALCGHLPVVHLLLFYLSNQERNKQSLAPSDLAYKANHQQIGQFLEKIEALKTMPSSKYEEIFGTNDFHYFASVILYYTSRWGIAYDVTYQSYYYIDYITNVSQWERPDLLDLPLKAEKNYQKASELLLKFYGQYNPLKVTEIPAILAQYQGNYTNLFITLANKYQIQDLSLFAGVSFD